MTSDPGRAFLYSQEPSSGHRRTQSRQLNHQPAASSLTQQGTPEGDHRRSSSEAPSQRGSTDSHSVAPAARSHAQIEADRNGGDVSALGRWEAAVGNVEDARVGFDVIARAIEGAVYLDEDAYSQVAPTAQFTKVIQAQQRKIADLERQLRETRFQLEESNAVQSEALQRHAEMQQELENNAVVFKMHYQELLAKDEEIQKLTAVIQALSGR